MESKQPDLEKFFFLPNPGLRAYFEHTVQGNPDDIRTPFWSGAPREEVLASWQKVFDGLGVQERYPSLYDYEMEMKEKVGSLSIQAPLSERIDSIESYYLRAEVGNSLPIPQEAVDATVDFFGKAKGLRLRSLERTSSEMQLATNAGNPWFGKRRKVLPEALDSQIFFQGDRVLAKVRGRVFELGAVLGWRGQEGGPLPENVKQRVIWMMSLLLNMHELRFYQSAVAAFQQHELIPAYVSMDCVDRAVTRLFETKGAGDVVICTDFSKFDQSFNPYMQDAALRVWRGLATPSAEMEEWFRYVYPAKFNIPLICSSGLAYYGPHGMGSGSGGTNADECMAHKCLQFDACLRKGTYLNPYSMAYGDDGILTAPGLTVDDVVRAYTSHGMEMNPSKQYVSTDDCVVLRRWHSTSYRENGVMVGVYSTFRALGRLLGQERFYDPKVWGPEMVTLRAWSILENCNHSPYFEEFVQFVMQGDRTRLGLDLDGFIDRIDQNVKKAIDQLPDFLGYTKTIQTHDARDVGVRNWRIYKYLKSLQ